MVWRPSPITSGQPYRLRMLCQTGGILDGRGLREGASAATMRLRSRPIATAVVLAASVVVVAAGCGGGGGSSSSSKVPASAVAVVGDRQISEAELNTLLASVKSREEARNQHFPGKATVAYRTLRRKALQALVRESELEQKSAELGVRPVTAQDVDAQLAKVKQQTFGGSESAYTKELKREGLTETELRADLHDTLVADRLHAHVIAGITVSEQEIRDFYERNKTQYGHPATREIRHILVASKSLADSIEQQLKNGTSFVTLVEKYSKDTGSASNGGKVTISEGHTIPQLDKVAFSLKTNEFSQPVASSYGWHIIEAIGPVVQATFTPLAQKRAEIRTQVLKLKQLKRWTTFVANMKKEFAGKTHYRPGYEPASSAKS